VISGGVYMPDFLNLLSQNIESVATLIGVIVGAFLVVDYL
jgi:hypothetical protein